MSSLDGRSTRSTPARSLVIAPIIDAIALVVFVAAGRESHGLNEGAGWFLDVLWPLACGWFVVAAAVMLYARRGRVAVRLAITIIAGIGAGLVLRATVTHRATPVAFVIVAFAFITMLTVGWRLVALGVRELARRRAAVS